MNRSESIERNGRTAHRRADADDGRDYGSDRHMSVEEIADAYADLAETLDRWAFLERRIAGRYRRRQFGDVEGRVLDVACGTGRNFRYVPASVELVGVDISREMLAKAREKVDRFEEATLRRMDAQDLAFPDDSFDAVVSSFSTCTFPDPVAALEEMRRVCKPDGRILLLEHGRSSVGPVARFQDWRADAHYETAGCRLNQEPLRLVREAGLPVVATQETLLGVVTRIEARPAVERSESAEIEESVESLESSKSVEGAESEESARVRRDAEATDV